MSLIGQINTLATRIATQFKTINYVKGRVKVVSTTNITLSGTQTIDGVAVGVGDRVLVAGQTTKTQNGVYIVASGAWTRDTDFDTTAKAAIALIAVDQGSSYFGTLWTFPIKSTNTLGSTNVTPQNLVGVANGGTVAESLLPNRIKANPSATTDWDTATSSGIYYSAGNATHAPTSIAGEWTGCVSWAANYISQVLVGGNDSTTPVVYVRTWDVLAGAFGAWEQVVTRKILGDTTALFTAAGNLTVRTGSVRFPVPSGTYTIQEVRVMVGTAPATQSVIVDVNKNGTTIYGTQANRPTIAAGSNAATGGTASVTSVAGGDYLTADIDQIGTGTVGADLTVMVALRRTA
jgi:hypothetical protein